MITDRLSTTLPAGRLVVAIVAAVMAMLAIACTGTRVRQSP